MAHSELVNMLELEPSEPDHYLGRNLDEGRSVVFGGQLLAQSIAAAALANPDLHVKSMHSLFLRGGRPELPLDIEVDRIREGRTFAGMEVSIPASGSSKSVPNAHWESPLPSRPS